MNYSVSFADGDEGFISWLNTLGSEKIRQMLYAKYMTTKSTRGGAISDIGSADKGKMAEASIYRLLSQHFTVSYNGSTAKSGDLMVTHNGKRILVEIKDHKCAVKTAEIVKFDRDIAANEGIDAAMFISLNSSIVKQSSVDFTMNPIPRLMLAMPSDDTILAMMKFLISVTSETISAVTLNTIISNLDVIGIVRHNITELLSHNEKVLSDESFRLRVFENNIVKLITNSEIATYSAPADSIATTPDFAGKNFDKINKILFNTMNKSFYVTDNINYQIVTKLIQCIGFGEDAKISETSISNQYCKIKFLKSKTVFETNLPKDTIIPQDKLLANMAKINKNKLTCPISHNTFDFIASIIVAIESAHI